MSVEFDKNFEHPRLPKSQRTYHFASDYISHGLQSFWNMYPLSLLFVSTLHSQFQTKLTFRFVFHILWKFNRRSIEFYLQKRGENSNPGYSHYKCRKRFCLWIHLRAAMVNFWQARSFSMTSGSSGGFITYLRSSTFSISQIIGIRNNEVLKK